MIAGAEALVDAPVSVLDGRGCAVDVTSCGVPGQAGQRLASGRGCDYSGRVHCKNCDAPVVEGAGRFCSHCGTVLPDAPRIAPHEYVTHAERFEAAGRAEGYAAAMAHAPAASSLPGILGPLAGIAGVGVFFGVLMPPAPASAPPVFKVGKLAMATIMVGVFAYLLVKGIRFHRAPLERLVAVVLEERTEVREVGKKGRTRSHYFVTLQRRDGTRRECETSGAVAGQVTRADIGVAYVKGQRLVGFRRLEA